MEIEDEKGERRMIRCQLVKRKQKYYNVVKPGSRKQFMRAETVQLSEMVTDVTGVQYRAGWSKIDELWILSRV